MSKSIAREVFERNWPKHLEDLENLVRIPSVSFDGFPPAEVRRSAEAVAALLKKSGLQKVEILEMQGAHPYVYAEWLGAPGKPTLLLYAHHDVQPPGRIEKWESPPFEPTRKQGPGGERLFGRGAADDKAGVLVHVAAISSYLEATGTLPVNVKIVIEGEEEIGSDHLPEFLKKHREKLQADVLVLTDTMNFDCGVPGLTVALRGMAGFEVEVRALTKTIHSGMWGGPIPDPVMGLAKMLATLVDAEGRIAVAGIQEMVPPITPEEEREMKRLPVEEADFRKQAGVVPGAKLLHEGPSLLGQTWRFPSLTINGIQAAQRGAAGNVIHDVAWARLTVRIPGGMDSTRVNALVKDHLKREVPWGLEVQVKDEGHTGGWIADTRGPRAEAAFAAAERALEKGYGVRPYRIGCGGSIPFVKPFAEALGGAPALLIGVEDPYTNAHGENESLLISDLKKACLSQIELFEELSDARHRNSAD